MAINLWGNIYYKDAFAGVLSQEAGGRYVFIYSRDYLQSSLPPISYTLPLRPEPHLSEYGLHPFFDNLCAEGWLQNAQAQALGLLREDRFPLLLAFGTDLAGAVSVIDPDPARNIDINFNDPENIAALSGRASLSGIQPKLGAIREGSEFRSVGYGEQATFIAKLPSPTLPDILELEYITTQACSALLKYDTAAEMILAPLRGISERALLVKRFDRTENGEKIHFEEFNQLLGNRSEDKYKACYGDMANFIIQNRDLCMRVECDTLFRRIIACILTGNTDAHLKNFAMEHTKNGLRLAPCYDLVAAACYPQYQTLALGIGGNHGMRITNIGPKNIAQLGNLFKLPDRAIMLAVSDFAKNLDRAHGAIDNAKGVEQRIKDKLHQQMKKRWNGIFDSIGIYLSKKQLSGERNGKSPNAA